MNSSEFPKQPIEDKIFYYEAKFKEEFGKYPTDTEIVNAYVEETTPRCSIATDILGTCSYECIYSSRRLGMCAVETPEIRKILTDRFKEKISPKIGEI